MSIAEYSARYRTNEIVNGTQVHLPCPFCAAPWFMIYDIKDILAQTATCYACDRSGKFVENDTAFTGISYEFVQTGGSNPPSWLSFFPRRVSA